MDISNKIAIITGGGAGTGGGSTGTLEALREDAEESLSLPDEVGRGAMFEDIVGSCRALRAVLWRVTKVAPTDSTVLITGETGSGKELIARAIHRGSRRSVRPFVSVNCAATPASLIATELFGHEKGAFTGALQRRAGRFEVAAGGTLFLDEVGELPMETQTALLRVLQEREFERVGGTTAIRADVRVVAATNRDLGAAIAAGMFRSDLYYRLNVFPIEVPPLRERREDIRTLVEVFVDRYADRAGKRIRRISKRTLAVLEAYRWPGNIRELQNVIERSVIMCESEVFSIDESWLFCVPAQEVPARQPLRLLPFPEPESRRGESTPSNGTLEEIEREAILRALRLANGMVGGGNGAATILGLKRTTLQGRMRKLGIAPTQSGGRRPLEPGANAPTGDLPPHGTVPVKWRSSMVGEANEDRMRKSRFNEEKIIALLKEVESGAMVTDVCRRHAISEQTNFRSKRTYGGLNVNEARRVKSLEEENRRLKQIIADLKLDNQALKAVDSKKWRRPRSAARSRAFWERASE